MGRYSVMGGPLACNGLELLVCKVWDTASGNELVTLKGHKNVVYAISFNNPFGDKVATGSFDKTARVWDATTGNCHY